MPVRDLHHNEVPDSVFLDLFEEPIGALLLENGRVRLIVFNPEMEAIERWIS